MSLNYSKTLLLYIPLLTSIFYGCAQRHDLAPVVTTLQEIDQYHHETPILSENSLNDRKSPAAVVQIPDNKDRRLDDIEISADSIPSIQARTVEKETLFHVVKKNETLFSISLRSGQDYQDLAKWNDISPPYHIQTGQKIRLFNPDPDKNIVELGSAPLKSADNIATERKIFTPVNSNIKVKKKTPKRIPPPPKTRKIKINSALDKKKSIISIDNRNKLMLNFQWPIMGNIKKNFSQTNRKGIDIVGKIGQTVQAAEAGIIVYCGQGIIGFGNTIVIKHNDTYLSAYANNSNLLVKEGEFVKKGQSIAEAGMTASKKAMLHFEIRKNGKSVDPLTLLPKRD